MARTAEDIVQIQLGGQALQIARLLSENETLREKVEELSGKLKSNPDEPGPAAKDSE